jgi:hypothetical protein
MSVLRLLATGRSLVGLKEPVSPYRMRTQGLLPKFGSSKNPFAAPTRPEPPAAPARQETGTLFEAEPKPQPVTPTPVKPAKPVRAVAAAPMAAAAVVEPKPPGPARVDPAALAKSSSIWGWVKQLSPRSLLVRRGPGAPKSARSWPSHRPVQAELSLDKVKVVRNDLTDTDLEIVPARLMGLPSGASPVLSQSGKSEPAAWDRLASRFFGAEKTHAK